MAPAHGSWYDGIVVEYSFLENPVLVHEVGHYFNLLHSFGSNDNIAVCTNNNCLTDNDKVCDTRPDGSLFTCGVTNYCHTDSDSGPFLTDENDPIGNFMDYGPCGNYFTVGQKNRMRDAIEQVRFSLLENTGGCCPSGPMFATFSYTLNASETEITLNAIESTPSNLITAYEWKFGNNAPISSSSPEQTFTLPSETFINICLTIYGTTSDCSDTYCTNICVGGGNGCNYICNKDFESPENVTNPNGFAQDKVPGWKCVQPTPSYSTLSLGFPFAPENAGSAFLLDAYQYMDGGVLTVSGNCEAIRAKTGTIPDNKKYIFSLYKKSPTISNTDLSGVPYKTMVLLDFDKDENGIPDDITGACQNSPYPFYSIITYNDAKTIFMDENFAANTEFQRFVSCFELQEGENKFMDVVVFPLQRIGGSGSTGINVTRVELVEDYFNVAVGQDQTISCPSEIILGNDIGCNLTDVFYKWEKVVSPGVFQTIVENLSTPQYNMYITETTIFKLTREIRDFQGNPVSPCNGIAMEDFVTITVQNPNPNPIFTFDEPIDCQNNICFTSEDDNPNTVHSWIFEPSSPATNLENPCHIFSTIGNYDVIHTVTNTCGVLVQTMPISIVCDPNFGYEINGCSNTIHFDSYSNGLHLWEVIKDGVVVQTFMDDDPNITFTGTGTFIVKHNISGTSSEKTFTFIGTDGNSTTIASSLTINNFTNQFVSFKGAFIIDVSTFTINGIEGRMGDGSTVIVNGNMKLKVYNSSFTSCDKMWRGFEAKSGSSLTIHGSIIEDAQYAIKAFGTKAENNLSATIISIKGNDFDQNFIGVYVPRSDLGKNQNVAFMQFYGNHFNCTAALKPLYPGQISDAWIPQTNNWAYAGVWVADLTEIGIGTSPISNPSNYTNTFTNLRNGVYAEHSYLTVLNTTFENMSIDNAYNGFPTGNGIYTYSVNNSVGKLTQKGLGDTGPLSFKSCQWGIYSRGTEVNISDNNMGKVNVGVTVQGCKFGDIGITDNDIIAFSLGVQLLHNGNASQTLKVFDNDITVQNPPIPIASFKGGIRIEDDMLAYSNAVIDYNRITLELNNASGIYLNSAKNIETTNNTITMNSTNTVVGINLFGCDGGLLEGNTINGLSPTYLKTSGINVNNTPNLKYCCNIIDNTYWGMIIQGMCVSEQNFQANIYKRHNTGLLVTPTGGVTSILGLQTHMGNRWEESVQQIPIGAKHDGNPLIALNSLFRVDPNVPDFFPDYYTPTQWFDPIATPNPNCLTAPSCGNCNFNCFDGDPSEFEKKLAQNNPETQDYNEVVRWQGERNLYRTLTDYPEQMIGQQYLQNFYNQTSSSSTDGFMDVENGIAAMFLIDSSYMSQLGPYKSDTDSIIEQMRVKREAFIDATPAQILVLEDELLDLTEQLGLVIDAYNTLLNSLGSDISTTSSSVKSINNGIAAVPVYQTNEKAVNNILLEAIENGQLDFTSAQTLLENIANQCPYEGGNAVFRARSMVVLIDETITYDDEILCHQIRERNSRPISAGNLESLEFYPNPAQNWLTVKYDFPNANSLFLGIYNSSGIEVAKVSLPIDEHVKILPLDQLVNGIYNCKITDNGKLVAVKKLAIIR